MELVELQTHHSNDLTITNVVIAFSYKFYVFSFLFWKPISIKSSKLKKKTNKSNETIPKMLKLTTNHGRIAKWRCWRNHSKRHQQANQNEHTQKHLVMKRSMPYHCQHNASHPLREPHPTQNPPFQIQSNRLAKSPMVLWVINYPYPRSNLYHFH